MNTAVRLEAPMGLLIDRDKPISFRFEGETYQGLVGDTLASALVANGRMLLSRSFKYHRPRGPLTMAGQDANTLVQLGREANVMADREPLAEGDDAKGQNYSGSLDRDRNALLGIFARFMPVGFYYRAFFKLPFLKSVGTWQFFEPSVRKKAGLGVLDLDFKPDYHDKAYLFHDLVVVGGGPAGLSAALVAAEGGADVLLVDEQRVLGGALSYHRFDIEGHRAEALRQSLLDQVSQNTRITVLSNAVCNAWYSDNYLPVIQGSRLYKVRATECIVASGAFEQHVVFRNNDLPGVMMASAASRLMRHYAVKPGNRAVVLTGNDDGYLCALELLEQGVELSALVDMRLAPEATSLSARLAEMGVAIYCGHTVYEALPGRGRKGLRAVEIRQISGRGEVSASGQTLDCDLLCMSAGYMPAYQLLCQAGAQLSYDDERADFSIRKLPKALRIAGSVNGVHDLDAVILDGKRAALEALAGLNLDETEPLQVNCDRRVNFEWPIFPHPKGKDFVDFDEDLQVSDIVNATRLGYRDVQLVKRYSTVGMGPSQGRHSALPTARLVAEATGRTVTQTGVTTARPPYNAEKLAHLAGRIFDPYKRTPMHGRHVTLGAKMMPAGTWQRPAYYGKADERDSCMHAESVHVRTKVGVIDLSTLGGIELRGPDAAEFINRMYTFAFRKQPVGKTRYAVLTNEQGVVIDDGVACRIGEQHFYVTATTSGVDNVHREMLKWAAQWCLDVDIANVTSAFAAVNVAGPDARKVLEQLTTDIDVSPAEFPYLAYREGHIGGIPARLLRVGFVGELGYEIHVPSRYGEVLWDSILEAGQHFDIRPFGVETQRLLRLEKGHIIVSQDTDGMSHPGELSLEWAINRKKPFFVGRRSVDILMAQPQTRKLVGFKLPLGSSKPEEGHLVLEGERISGNVTSCEVSPTVGAIIGLAYVGIDQCEPGFELPIRVEGGEIVRAEIATLPFYDPANQRQEL